MSFDFDDYTDSDRLDELATMEDYNRFEEEQVFQDSVREQREAAETDEVESWQREDMGYFNERLYGED